MKPAATSPATSPLLEPFVLGTALSAVSALAYSCANVCLRQAATGDPMLVSCVKAVPTLLVASALVARGAMTGRVRWPSRAIFFELVGIGVLSQLGGNALFQWALGQVGLALTVPLCSGAMIIGSAILARVLLGEGVSPRSAVALTLLITAIVILSYGAERHPEQAEIETALEAAAETSTAVRNVTTSVTLALGAALFSGLVYAGLNVVIRRVVTRATQMPVVLATICSAGVVSLGAGSILRLGWQAVADTPLDELLVMFVAGMFNAAGFFALTKALQLVSIVQVNAVSASQSAFAALTGVALFGESWTTSLTFGVLLTIAGLSLVDRGRKLGGQAAPGAEQAHPYAGSGEEPVPASPLALAEDDPRRPEPTTM